MSQTLLAIVTFFILSVIKSASSDGDAAAAVSGYQNHEMNPSHTAIDYLAVSIAEWLLHSPVLGEYAHFQVKDMHDLLFRVGSRFLAAAGIYAPNLAEVDAEAGREVGPVNSKLYLYSIGYMVANFFQNTGVLSYDNAEYLALKIVSAIELVACSDGIFDTETTMNAVVYGIFNVLVSYGFINHGNVKELFYLFAEEIAYLSGKC